MKGEFLGVRGKLGVELKFRNLGNLSFCVIELRLEKWDGVGEIRSSYVLVFKI